MGADWAAVWVALLIGLATVLASGVTTWLQLREGRSASLREARLGQYAQLITLLSQLLYRFRDVEVDSQTLERIDVCANTITLLDPPKPILQAIDLCASLAREVVFGVNSADVSASYEAALKQLVEMTQADLTSRFTLRAQRHAEVTLQRVRHGAVEAGRVPTNPTDLSDGDPRTRLTQAP